MSLLMNDPVFVHLDAILSTTCSKLIFAGIMSVWHTKEMQ